MADNHISDGPDAKGARLVSDGQSQAQHHVQNTIAVSQHRNNVGNDHNNVVQNVADVGEPQSNVQDQDSEEEHGAVVIHPDLPQDILAVDFMSQKGLVAALEVLSATNIPAEAVCIDVGIVEAIVVATVTFLHHTHTQCIRRP